MCVTMSNRYNVLLLELFLLEKHIARGHHKKPRGVGSYWLIFAPKNDRGSDFRLILAS
jgi:hypothetical protein